MENIKKYKITVFGDSIPKGLMMKDGKVVKLTSNAIDILEKHYDVKITNNSSFGQTLKRLCKKGIIDKYISELQPNDNNLVVFSIGGNDSDFDWPSVALDPDFKHNSKTDIKEFSLLLDDVTTKLQEKDVKVVFVTLFPIDSQRYFENVISTLCDGEQIMKFFHQDISNINRHQECFNIAIVNNAVKHNCLLLDIRSEFLLDTYFLRNLSLDGIHPNDEGQAEIAKIIIKQLG